MKCPRCSKKFPDVLCTEMCVNGDYTEQIDAICALRIRNKLHGLPKRAKFSGLVAHGLFLQAIDHLEQTGQQVPKWAQDMKNAE